MATLETAIEASKAKRGAAAFTAAGNKVVTSGRRMDRSIATTTRRMDGMGKASKTASFSMRRLVAVIASAAILRKTIRTIASYQTAVATLQGVTRATADEMERMTKVARNLGATTEFTAVQATDALVMLGRAGFDAAESTAALPGVLDLATASAIDLSEAANITANTIRQFGLATDAFNDVAGILVATSNASNTNVTQLGEALKLVGPVASAVGNELHETTAVLGTLADNGLKASLAGTSLRAIYSRLLETTERNRKAFRALGLEMEDLDPRTKSLADIFDILNERGFDAADAVRIFGRRAFAGALILSRTTDRVRDLTKEIDQNRDAAKKNADLIRDTLTGDIKELTSAFDELLLKTGDKGLAGVLRNATQAVTGFLRAFTDPANSVLLQDIILNARLAAEEVRFTFVGLAEIVENTFHRVFKAVIDTFQKIQDSKILKAIEAIPGIGTGASLVRLGAALPEVTEPESIEALSKRLEEENVANIRRLVEERDAIVRDILGDGTVTGAGKVKQTVVTGLEDINDELDKNAEKATMLKEVYTGVGQAIGETFESAIFDAENATDALEGLLRDVSRMAFQIFVTNQLAGAFGSLFSRGPGDSVPAPNLSDFSSDLPFDPGAPSISPGGGTFGGDFGGGGFGADLPISPGAPSVAPNTVNVVQNIRTPNADSFRKSKMQIARDARDMMRGSL